MIEAVLFDLGDTLVVEEAVGGRHLWEVELQKVPYVDEVLLVRVQVCEAPVFGSKYVYLAVWVRAAWM